MIELEPIKTEVAKLNIENFPTPPTIPEREKDHYTILQSELMALVDRIRQDLNYLSEKNKELQFQNQKLKEAFETRSLISQQIDTRKEVRRAFDLTWSEVFGEENFPFLKKHFKERLGL